ncbi:MAG: hypothetical protein RO469_15890 [Thermincola sp.]|jgi:hypothetical protein|nr:hypothetical protein [Thermincola sp.]MDT3704512.1 hypothetical protein [Thermincola sp.]
MILFVRKRMIFLAGLAVLHVLGMAAVSFGFMSKPASGTLNYRVFVAGIGTIEGKWSGETGIAVMRIETKPDVETDQELKVIDLLVANRSSEDIRFKSDIGLIDKLGRRFELQAEGQPEVSIEPGTLSQGTVMISVPKGVSDQEWLLEVKGGNLKDTVLLPLKVVKVKETSR